MRCEHQPLRRNAATLSLATQVGRGKTIALQEPQHTPGTARSSRIHTSNTAAVIL